MYAQLIQKGGSCSLRHIFTSRVTAQNLDTLHIDPPMIHHKYLYATRLLYLNESSAFHGIRAQK